MFCPKCSSILMPKSVDGKRFMGCSCGYRSDATGRMSEEVKIETRIDVVHEDVQTLPLVDADCPKCNHAKAYFWSIQTRASDEPETKFFRCEKCKHTWKDYS